MLTEPIPADWSARICAILTAAGFPTVIDPLTHEILVSPPACWGVEGVVLAQIGLSDGYWAWKVAANRWWLLLSTGRCESERKRLLDTIQQALCEFSET